LLGKKKGEVAEIPVPRGTVRFKVLKIALANLRCLASRDRKGAARRLTT